MGSGSGSGVGVGSDVGTGVGTGFKVGIGLEVGTGLEVDACSEAGGWVSTCSETEALGRVPRGWLCSAVGPAQAERAHSRRSTVRIVFHLRFLGFTGFRSFFFDFIGTSSNILKINTALYRYKSKLE